MNIGGKGLDIILFIIKVIYAPLNTSNSTGRAENKQCLSLSSTTPGCVSEVPIIKLLYPSEIFI